MALPAPNLDDRRFQELVDDAKRLVQQRCPEWSDHNVSDPGVTLIELFAWMTDQVVYRLNRVPDRNYVKFLDLIGVRLFPPNAAKADVTFWLSAPQDDPMKIPAGTQVSTVRTETLDAIGFETIEDLTIPPVSLERVFSQIEEDKTRNHTSAAQRGQSFFCFDKPPKAGDSLLIGLSDAAPSCAVNLRLDCNIEGRGVDPLNPPLVWEAWDGEGWTECELDADETGGLNRAGNILLHVPRTHVASLISNQRAGWLRCRVIEAEEGQPTYGASPQITSISAFSIGGTATATHAQSVNEEILGISEGVAGQRFGLKRKPVVPGDAPRVLQVAGEEGWQDWSEVTHFADSDPDSRHFLLDAINGEVALGPAVREPDGSLRQYGAVPPKGAVLRMATYRTGGGRHGNVSRGSLRILRTSIPFIDRVENRHPARGGVDAESIEDAKDRGPVLLRTGNRAVTTEDYEVLAREAAPEIARVRAVAAGDGADAGSVRVLIVPAAAADGARLRFEQLVPTDESVQSIASYLDERRMIGARVAVEPPSYQGVTIVARIRARPRTEPTRLQQAALEALYAYFNPITGGSDGKGWDFGRPVHAGEVYSVLQGLRGTELVEEAKLYAADPTTGERGKATERIEVGKHALIFSYEHRVRVDA
jgi:predicted phage baseplate assembly protein